MCGITGIVLKKGEEVQKELLLKMTDSMTHRGPDEDGIDLFENVGIGMRRLSIMDVASGHQPFFSNDKRISVVGNGEIYNHAQLRLGLKNDHQFHSSSDIEVIAPLFLKHGLQFPSLMEGMFGLAILDKAERKLHLIRDRIGVKPLFYHASKDAFMFSSDINSIISSGKVSVSLNEQSANNYFNYRFGASGNETFFNEIKIMFPGQILSIDIDTLAVTESHFHDYLPFSTEELFNSSEAELIDELDKRLRNSVEKRLMADVPLASLLSSGIDSTLLTALANGINPNKVDAFTITYNEKSLDESEGAKESADYLGIKWHPYQVSNEEFTSNITDAIRYNEAPVTHPNSIAVHLITKLAKENGYKVLLSGEGADELFAGYGRTTNLFHLSQIQQKYPSVLLQFLSASGLKFDKREAEILRALSTKDYPRMASAYFSVVDQDFNTTGSKSVFLSKVAKQITAGNLFNDILQTEQRTYLQELLLRQDKMSMWSSMEVRVPFVGDPNVVSFANQLPFEYKLKNGVNKYLLRKVAEKYLPPHISHRKKKGFGSPVGDWLKQNDQLKQLAYSAAESSSMDSRQRKIYLQLLDDHVSGKADNYEMVWKIMNFLLFRKEYGI